MNHVWGDGKSAEGVDQSKGRIEEKRRMLDGGNV